MELRNERAALKVDYKNEKKEAGFPPEDLMNELVTRQQEQGLAISTETKELIQSSIADSTLKRYQRLSRQIEAWLKGAMLTDALLADYLSLLSPIGGAISRQLAPEIEPKPPCVMLDNMLSFPTMNFSINTRREGEP